MPTNTENLLMFRGTDMPCSSVIKMLRGQLNRCMAVSDTETVLATRLAMAKHCNLSPDEIGIMLVGFVTECRCSELTDKVVVVLESFFVQYPEVAKAFCVAWAFYLITVDIIPNWTCYCQDDSNKNCWGNGSFLKRVAGSVDCENIIRFVKEFPLGEDLASEQFKPPRYTEHAEFSTRALRYALGKENPTNAALNVLFGESVMILPPGNHTFRAHNVASVRNGTCGVDEIDWYLDLDGDNPCLLETADGDNGETFDVDIGPDGGFALSGGCNDDGIQKTVIINNGSKTTVVVTHPKDVSEDE